MKRQTPNRSNLLLMEIIIAILFFSIVSAICVQLFVKSHMISRHTQILDNAVNKANSVAELIYSTDNPEDVLVKYYPDMEINGDKIFIYYTSDFKLSSKSKAAYCIEVEKTGEAERTIDYKLVVTEYNSSSSIYELDVVAYIPLKL